MAPAGRARRNSLAYRMSAMPGRRDRWAVLLCVLVVCGSLTVAAILQMGLDVLHMHRLRDRFNETRATEILASAEDQLDHFETVGLLFANGGLAGEAVAALPGINGISVAAENGQMLRYSGTPLDMPALAALLRGPRTVIGTGSSIVIVYRIADRVVGVDFSESRFLPPGMLKESALISPAGKVLAGKLQDTTYARVYGRKWPLQVHAAIHRTDSLSGYWGLIPVLYIYLVLAPLAAGFWLFRIFRREIIWRAQASLIIRTMRAAWQARYTAPPDKRRPG